MATQSPGDAVKQLAEIDVEKVISSATLAGEMLFEPLRDELLGIRQMASGLTEVDWEKAPQELVKRVMEQCISLHQRVLELGRFNGSRGDAITLMKSVRQVYMQVLSNAPPLLAIDSSPEKVRSQSALILSDLEDRQQEAEKILQSLQRAAGQVVVAIYSEHFDNEARDSIKMSRWWLGSAVVAGVLTVLLALLITFHPPLLTTPAFGSHQTTAGGASDASYGPASEWPTAAVIVQSSIGKLVMFSVLYFFVIWSGRNYRSSRHNAVVNQHRRNAINTFEAFVQAAGDDPEIRRAVLLQTTQAIFAPQASGFISREAESGASNPQVLEILTSRLSGKSA